MSNPVRARLVVAFGELRRWRLLHEPSKLQTCISCGDRGEGEIVIQEDGRGRRWRIHIDTGLAPLDAECLRASVVPPRWSMWAFERFRISPALRALESATEGLRTGYCPACGEPLSEEPRSRGWCMRHNSDPGVGVPGYQ